MEPISIAQELAHDRFSRLRLIRWWDQERVATTRVLVVGAGALGNEILKNLALSGFRRIVVVDADRIEVSNLTRAVLFRTTDVGRPKAEIAAQRTRDLYPEALVRPLEANILFDAGLGLFRWADLIVAGLDNREARLWINRAAWKTGRPWIDGAIEGINGVARVFLPGQPPCYECTLGETDWAILDRRLSCNLLLHETDAAGKVPTTPTISSIIAGVQVQEALKLIHGLPVLDGRGLVFEGLNHSSYVVTYTENPDCLSHDTIGTVIPLAGRSSEITPKGLLEQARADLDTRECTLEFSRDLIARLRCVTCGKSDEVWRPAGSVRYEQGRCPCGAMRDVESVHGYTGSEEFGDRTLEQLGLPRWDWIVARSSDREIAYSVMGDAAAVLGDLA